jgi:DNA topoisomerase-1
MNLVIVESPAKCAKIKSFLGDGWRVVATMGHIRALAEDLDAIGLDRDFEPRFEFLKTKSKAITGLKDSIKGCSQVYLAADDDREGEAIAFSVCKLLKLDPTATPRAVFHEITKPAIQKAVANPRRIDMPKVFAQQTRAMLDMMIGFTMSPLLWGIKRGLSAGRCQTPALRLVVEKEKEIDGFTGGLSWQVEGSWTAAEADGGFTSRKTGSLVEGFTFGAKMSDVLEDEESVQNYLEIRQGAAGATVRSAIVKPWQLGAPEPFITSTLQQQASASLRMNPKRTMQVAQKLYEDGHITYMRTDSTALSEEAREEAKEWIREHLGAEYLGALATIAPKPKKSTKKTAEVALPEAQAAHECIRPTHFDLEELDASCESGERSLYRLIRNRTLQSLMARCEGETRRVVFDCDEDDQTWPWEASWKRTTFEGWRRLGRVAILDENENDTDADNTNYESWTASGKLTVGTRLQWSKLVGRAVIARAATRYTEATLVRELEKRGIGRPSTFASLIAAITDKGYVEVKNIEAKKVAVNHYELSDEEGLTVEEKQVGIGGEKQKMVPTALGRSVIDFLMREYSDIFDYGFTANMEQGLDLIASGAGAADSWKNLLRTTWGSYKDRYYKHKILTPVAAGAEGGVPGSAKIRNFPPYKAVMSGKGPLLLKEGATKADKTIFYGWPDGFEFSEITEEAAVAFCEKRAAEIAAKPVTATVGVLKTIGSYVFREGKSGMSRYMYKDGLKDRKFVTIPESLDLEKITEKEAANVYKIGLAQIAERSSGSGGRGGFRGRGRGRGR